MAYWTINSGEIPNDQLANTSITFSSTGQDKIDDNKVVAGLGPINFSKIIGQSEESFCHHILTEVSGQMKEKDNETLKHENEKLREDTRLLVARIKELEDLIESNHIEIVDLNNQIVCLSIANEVLKSKKKEACTGDLGRKPKARCSVCEVYYIRSHVVRRPYSNELVCKSCSDKTKLVKKREFPNYITIMTIIAIGSTICTGVLYKQELIRFLFGN